MGHGVCLLLADERLPAENSRGEGLKLTMFAGSRQQTMWLEELGRWK
jgi:hypothetical protein